MLGAGHSAIGTLIDLTRLAAEIPDTQPVWILRGGNPAKAFGGGANDKLVARGELGAQFAALFAAGKFEVEKEFQLSHIHVQGDRIHLGAGSSCCGRHVIADELIVATGFRSDTDLRPRAAHPPRSRDRIPARARAADRSERA